MLAQGCKLLVTTVALVVAWTGVAVAQQPIQPLGDQLRLTQQGVDGTQDVDANFPDVAYNSQRNEYLVVWENAVSGFEAEIFGRRLAANGAPIGDPFQISGINDEANFDGREPAVAYDFERDRYGVVYSRDDTVSGEREIFLQIVSGTGQLVALNPTDPPDTDPFRASFIGPDETATFQASSPDIAYRADVDGSAPGDAWVVVFDGDNTTDGQFDVFARRVPAAPTGFFIAFQESVSVMTATGDGEDPSVTIVPGSEDHAVAWQGSTFGPDAEVFVRRMAAGGGASGTQVPVTGNAADFDSASPSITANQDAGELLVAYQSNDASPEGDEISVQRLDVGLGQRGFNDQQVSSAAGTGTSFFVFGPSAAYHPGPKRYLITWIGNDGDRPGLSPDEREVQGTTLDANGAEGSPQDFVISDMGNVNDEDAAPAGGAIAVNGQTGRWLPVWSGDDVRPPLIDGEFEVFGRQVGENFDVDGDGVNVPADCNDGNPGIRPGAVDVFDNGIDEDCSGADAENPDRDGDGATRPGDCNDGNPAIRPGAPEAFNNEVDENCDGQLGRRIVDVDIERFFAVFRNHTRVTRLRVTKLQPGMRIQIRCKGKKCPKKLRKGKVRRVDVTQAGSRDFTKLFRKARLRPKAVIDVRVFQPGAIARVDKFVMRKAKLPRRKQRCIPPGVTRPQKC